MKNNEASGLDGIPVKFFKTFFKSNDSSSSQNDSDNKIYSDCERCLFIFFNKTRNSNFP